MRTKLLCASREARPSLSPVWKRVKISSLSPRSPCALALVRPFADRHSCSTQSVASVCSPVSRPGLATLGYHSWKPVERLSNKELTHQCNDRFFLDESAVPEAACQHLEKSCFLLTLLTHSLLLRSCPTVHHLLICPTVHHLLICPTVQHPLICPTVHHLLICLT